MEIWKDIKGYEGLYEVSNLGRIKSLKRTVKYINGRVDVIPEKIRINQKDAAGYPMITLDKNRKRKTFRIHQLMAIAFLGHKRCGFKLVVDHINNIKTDNRIDNLQVITSRLNSTKNTKNNTSKYKGVSFEKYSKKYKASISIRRKRINLGRFKDEYKAHLAYQKALKELT